MNQNKPIQVCTKCVLDSHDDPAIHFDSDGVCNYCHLYDEIMQKRFVYGREGEAGLNKIIAEIKENGKGKEYDCIVGLSGGVDSTYVAWHAKKLGLRPLAVHLDNGWNSELAVMNIQNILKKLDFDLYTYVINWAEFRDMQRAYIIAGVVDIEALTDHAISSTLQQVAKKHDIQYVLSGESVETEGILPQSWIHNKSDHVNIKAIHKKFGTMEAPSFPYHSYWTKFFFGRYNKLKFVPILNYISYNKDEAKKIIIRDLSWRDYGGKHYESVFTRFYQSYILPVKFNIDKRKSHYSALIGAKQITREEAFNALKEPIDSADRIAEDKEYIIKKLNFTEAEFDKIMKRPPANHLDFPSVIHTLQTAKKILGPFLWLYRKIKN